MLADFHFLRPWWLLALLPALFLAIAYSRKSHKAKNVWHQYCDSHLLSHLLVENAGSTKNTFIANWLLLIWALLTLAMAGPTWSMYANDVYQKNSARVIALNVSNSMNNTDIAPTRLDRAKYKILDLLKLYKEGQTGMVAFTSEAFVVTPLTSDTKTITNLIPAVDSSIMPVQGVNISNALLKSAELIKNAGYSQGEIVLITDSNPTSVDNQTAQDLASKGIVTDILIMADKNQINENSFDSLAKSGDGHAVMFSKNNADIEEISQDGNNSSKAHKADSKLNNATMWRDEGHWLIWIAMILAALLARKGWLNKLC